MNIDHILCHFGDSQKFNLEPALSSFRAFFPEARVILYTDNKSAVSSDGIDEIIEVVSPYDRAHRRYGWRCGDLFRAVGLLASKADVAIYSDADMLYFSDKVRLLPLLAKKFGFCIPANPRLLGRTDALYGTDSDKELGDSEGYGFAYNTTPLAFDTSSQAARNFLEEYVKEAHANITRGPFLMYKTVMRTGYVPYLLPFQWCVCREHIGVGDEIVLHLSHKDLDDYYIKKLPLSYIRLRQFAEACHNRLTTFRRAIKGIFVKNDKDGQKG